MFRKLFISWQLVKIRRFYIKSRTSSFFGEMDIRQSGCKCPGGAGGCRSSTGASAGFLSSPSSPSGSQQLVSVNNPPNHPTGLRSSPHTWQELVPLIYNKKGPTAFEGNSCFCCRTYLAWQVPWLFQGGISVHSLPRQRPLWEGVHG